MTLSRCQKALFAAIAQNFGRQGLHIMTACIRSAHEDCGTRHITVDGADDDLRNALAIASDGVHRAQSRALSVASRAGVSLQTQGKCGLGWLRRATDGPGPGGRQRRRGGELGGWSVRVSEIRPCATWAWPGGQPSKGGALLPARSATRLSQVTELKGSMRAARTDAPHSSWRLRLS